MSDIVERNIVGRIIEWQEQQETYDPEPWDLLCHAVDEIERLRAELNQYQAAGIPATVYERNKELLRDCVAKDAEIERLRAALERIDDWFRAYPVDVFTPLQGDPLKKTGDYDTKEKRNLITRASAAMARHMIDGISGIAREALDDE